MNTKKLAAEKAVERIKDGMIVGLGTGSTAYWAIQKIGERIKEGLNVKAVASSKSSEELALQLGIPMIPFEEVGRIDVTIDGADEVNPNFHLIKGGGGALLREKILAYHSDEFIVIVDDSKLVDKLGAFPLPIEIVPFATELTIRQIASLGCEPTIRMKDSSPFISDNGNWIVDCKFGTIEDPSALNEQLKAIPGIVENGLFISMTKTVIVGSADGTVKVL